MERDVIRINSTRKDYYNMMIFKKKNKHKNKHVA